MEKLSEFIVADLRLLFVNCDGRISFTIAPKELELTQKHERNLPLAQVRLTGDSFLRNYSAGLTCLESESSRNMKYIKQTFENNIITTIFESDKLIYENIISLGVALSVKNRIINKTDSRLTVEYLPSAVLSGIPFIGDAEQNIKVNRFRSFWSMEGRRICESLYSLGLENSWANGWGGRYLRYGQAGSMPVRGYHPLTVIEDTSSNISWGVYSEASASWQHELLRFGSKISLVAGVGDFDSAHNRFILEPLSTYTTDTAYVACVKGDCDDACATLIKRLEQNIPENSLEENLPVIYNEYCHTWGKPNSKTVLRNAQALKNSACKYFVIDAGWFRDKEEWNRDLGDWQPSKEHFPNGIENTAANIKENGMLAGIWFEPETVCENSTFYNADFFLKRDGINIINEDRKFLDFRLPAVRAHLKEKVLDFSLNNGFGYIKADYNDPIGIGVDGQSYGEGLSSHINSVIDFYKELTDAGIILEICASGGHRIEPKFLSIANMVSFSDAHEGHEGAIVAANLHRLAPPRQLQIWSVLRPDLELSEIRYRLGQGFMGRLCISGDIAALDKNQRKVMDDALDFYEKIKPVIKDGVSRTTSTNKESYLNPIGYQHFTRENEKYKLIVVHSFADFKGLSIDFSGTPLASWGNVSIKNKTISIPSVPFDCAAVLIKKCLICPANPTR